MTMPIHAANVSTPWLRLGLIAGALVCAGPWDASFAQRDGQTREGLEHWEYCDDTDEQYSLEDVVSHCSAIIRGWPVVGGTLVSAYLNRGDAYRAQRDYPRAIADFSQAIRLEPRASGAFAGRAAAHAALGDHVRAAADRAEQARLQAARPR